MSVFSSIESHISSFFKWAEKIFKKSATWEQTAEAVVNVGAPALETAIGFLDPAVLPIVIPIVSKVQSGLAQLGALTAAGNAVVKGSTEAGTAVNVLESMKENLGTMLNLAEVKNSANAQKITAEVTGLINVVEGLLNSIPQAPTSTAPAA